MSYEENAAREDWKRVSEWETIQQLLLYKKLITRQYPQLIDPTTGTISITSMWRALLVQTIPGHCLS